MYRHDYAVQKFVVCTSFLSVSLDERAKRVKSEVKNNCSLFEHLFKVRKNGVFLSGISLFVLEIFMYLYYANEQSDDIVNSSS